MASALPAPRIDAPGLASPLRKLCVRLIAEQITLRERLLAEAAVEEASDEQIDAVEETLEDEGLEAALAGSQLEDPSFLQPELAEAWRNLAGPEAISQHPLRPGDSIPVDLRRAVIRALSTGIIMHQWLAEMRSGALSRDVLASGAARADFKARRPDAMQRIWRFTAGELTLAEAVPFDGPAAELYAEVIAHGAARKAPKADAATPSRSPRADRGDRARPALVPAPYRPAGLNPTPRVIYRTRRKDLVHDGRVQRLAGEANLWAWRRFADRFIHSRPTLPLKLRTYLFERGFQTDKAALYGLPRADVDDYVSDLQAELFTYANGRDRTVLDNRQLFSQVFAPLAPLAERLCLISGGRLIPLGASTEPLDGRLRAAGKLVVLPVDAAAGDPLLIDVARNTAASAAGRVDSFEALEAQLLSDARECLVIAEPRCSARETTGRVRIFMLRDPRDEAMVIAGAVHGLRTERSNGFDGLVQGGVSVCIDATSGRYGAAKALNEDGAPVALDRLPDGPAPTGFVPGWWNMVATLHRALRLAPMFSAVQFDLTVDATGAFALLDAKARCDAADFQVHGPLAAAAPAKRFMREYGL